MCQLPPDSHPASRFQVWSVAAFALETVDETGAATATVAAAMTAALRKDRVWARWRG
jgi:hypothetical protein